MQKNQALRMSLGALAVALSSLAFGESIRREAAAAVGTGDVSEAVTAVRTGDLSAVVAFVESQTDIDQRFPYRRGENTLLGIAIMNHEDEIAVALLERGADLEKTRLDLPEVLRHGLIRTANWLLDNYYETPNGPPLPEIKTIVMPFDGYYQSMATLIDSRLARKFIWIIGKSDTLSGAILGGDEITAKRLMVEGFVEPHVGTLFAAARAGSPGLVRSLIHRGLDPNGFLPDPETGQPDTIIGRGIDRIKEMRAYPSLEKKAQCVLYELVRGGGDLPSDEMMSAAVESCRTGLAALQNALDEAPVEALKLAAEMGYLESVKSALDRFAAHGIAMDQATSAAVLAARAGNKHIVHYLLSAGVPVNAELLNALVWPSNPGLVRLVLRSEPELDQEAKFAAVDTYISRSNQGINPMVLLELLHGDLDTCAYLERSREIPTSIRDLLTAKTSGCR